jgi:carboxymethylenebutenolidase
MSVGWEDIQAPGGRMPVYVGAPEHAARCPGIIVIQHAGGVDAPIQDTVHRLRREGYWAAAPALYYRQAAQGLDNMQRMSLLRDAEVLDDVRATLDCLRARTDAPVGIVGFCMGGRVSYMAAGRLSGLSAAVVFYGGNIMKAWGEGEPPFAASAGISCPLLGLFGAEDANPSAEDVAAIGAELTRLGKWHEFHSYRGAGHAFQNFLSAERYRERAARASWAEALAFFNETLRGARAA